MNRSIHVEYDSGGRKGSEPLWSASTLDGIADFHELLQLKRKIKHKDYKITRVYQSYTGGDGLTKDSDFDLPGGPNPDLSERRQGLAGPEQTGFGF